MTPRRFSIPLAAAALAGVSGFVVLAAGSAGADASYDATARTETFTLNVANQSIPTGIDIEGGGPAASARQDSVGIGDASAQLPYAGDTVPGLPGIGAGLFGFEAPAYPFIASTTKGSPPANVSYPGVELHAESGDFTTEASSIAGQQGSGATASARIDEAREGDVTSTASTGADSVKVGPYGTLSDVRSLATVFADGRTGKLTRTTSSSIGRISFPGLTFTVPQQSPSQYPVPIPIPGVPNQAPIPAPAFPFPGAGQTFHNPDLGIQDGYFVVTMPQDGTVSKYQVPAGPVLEALKAMGVTMRFQAPQETATGVIAGAYVFQYTFPAPPPNPYFTGDSVVTQSTAYALASVNLQPIIADGIGSVPPVTTAGATAAGPAGVDSAGLPTLGDVGALPTVPLSPVAGAAGGPSISLAGVKIGLG
ncbi:MAG TPA: hypothetical protein VMZ00_14110, partial [Sporichthya sp.]|nr:hypothetical protein [Sporichthya sp.]